jgi:cell division septation protein DedD
MPTNQKSPGESTPAANQEPISIQAEIVDDYGEVVTKHGALAPVAAERIAADAVEVKAVAVSITAILGGLPTWTSPEAHRSDAEFDPSAWPLNMLDLFSANAAAVLDFAIALGQAKSLSDAIELQSRFASERYSTLLRQSNEIAALMRRSAFGANAPVHLSVRAFIA